MRFICFETCSMLRCDVQPSDTVLCLARNTGARFALPYDTYTYLRISDCNNSELVEYRYPGPQGDNINVIRGVQGTEARMWPTGTRVCAGVTCAGVNDLIVQVATQVVNDAIASLGADIRALNNVWTGNNEFRGGVDFWDAVWSDEITAANALGLNTAIHSQLTAALDKTQYGGLIEIVRTVFDQPTYGHDVLVQSSNGISAPGALIGRRSRAWNIDTGDVPVTGELAEVTNENSACIEPKIGFSATFYNRPSGQAIPDGGLGSNRYNSFTAAFDVQSQARSGSGEYCGWNKGLRFRAGSLDKALEGAATNGAVGVDFIDIPTAEIPRQEAAIRLRPTMAIEWAADPLVPLYTRFKSSLNPITGCWELTNGGQLRWGIHSGTGQMFFPAVAVLGAAGAATGTYLRINVAGVFHKIALLADV